LTVRRSQFNDQINAAGDARGTVADWATEGVRPVSAPSDPLSFAADIKPLFREKDRLAMRRSFDLWSAADVAKHGEKIAEKLSDGSMPCDGAWPEADVARFTSWLAAGARP
jgi:hypothetical protein